MEKRLTIRVPDGVALQWEQAAAGVGVSLNQWIILQVDRSDAQVSLTNLIGLVGSLDRRLTAIHELMQSSGPDLVTWADAIAETLGSILTTLKPAQGEAAA